MLKIYFVLVGILMGSVNVFAQSKALLEANKAFQKEDYQTAKAGYETVLQKKPDNKIAQHNYLQTLYKTGQYEQMRNGKQTMIKVEKDKSLTADAWYDIGNSYMKESKWKEAVDAYKHCLKLNPNDADAKYNLSYALMKMKNDGGGGDNNKDQKDKDKQDQQNQQNKDNKQDQQDKNQDQNKEQQDDKDQQNTKDKDGGNKEEKNDEQKDQRPQPMPSKLSKEQANQILNALQNEEKKLQDKKNKESGVPASLQKDW